MCKSYVYYAYNARLECELHVACMELHETLESYVFGRARHQLTCELHKCKILVLAILSGINATPPKLLRLELA